MKKKWICLLLGGMLALSSGGCGTGTDDKKENDSGNDAGAGSGEEGDGNVYPTLSVIYPVNESSSMVLAELRSVGEVFYSEPSDWGYNYLMTEFKVIEDYYQKIPEGTAIRVPIRLSFLNDGIKRYTANSFENPIKKEKGFGAENRAASMDSTGNEGQEAEQISKEALSAFIGENKQAILFIGWLDEIKRCYKNKEGDWQDYVDFSSVSGVIELPTEYIPISNGIIPFNGMLDFLDANHCRYLSPNTTIAHFSSFIWDGMTMERAAENIRALYRAQLNGTADKPPVSSEGVDY